MRKTRQRTVILETLRDMDTHPTADMLYDRVRERLPDISLGTIYRNLELLCKLGLINEVESQEKNKRFDGNIDEHQHVQCTDCGSIADLSWSGLKDVLDEAQKGSESVLSGALVLFLGVCPRCIKSK